MITIHFTPLPADGKPPAPGPEVGIEEFDIEDEGDLGFTHDKPLIEWLSTSDHPSAVLFRFSYDEPSKYSFLLAYNTWWGQIEFVEDGWSNHTTTSLF